MSLETTPLISICIPTYNGGAFIKECLEGLFTQTYSNYEVIICDDGSKDNTVSIIKECIKGKSSITFIENEGNLGLVDNWNKCIALSKGDYIKFLFQDDHITPGALERIAGVIEKHRPMFITSKRKFILSPASSENAKNYFNTYLQKFENELGIKKDTFIELKDVAKLASKYIGINFIGEPSVYVFKKSVVETVGNFDKSFQQLCDLEFALRAISNTNLFYINDVTCEFRIHDSSATVVNINTRHFQITYFEYVNLVSRILYDNKFRKLRDSFTISQKLKLKIYLNNKIYTALKDDRVTGEEKNILKQFISNYPNTGYKNFGPLFFIIGRVLKFKNERLSK